MPGDAVFSSDRLGAVSMVTVAVDGSELTAGPVGGVPDATAVFTIEPASTSACVVTYVPVQVVDAWGTSVVTGHEITGRGPEPENAVSAAPTSVSVVLPVFTTVYEYVIVRPAAVTVVGEAVFSNDRLGAVSMVTVAVDGSELTAGPVGGVPDATAVFTIEPASTSACVTTYVPVQVVDAWGTSVVTGHEITGRGPEPENAVSAAPTSVSVVLPVFTTVYEYVTEGPAAATVLGEAVFSSDRLGADTIVTVAVDGSEFTAGPDGGVPLATAVLTIEPASTSACVVTYVPVQVVDAWGASVVTGHVITGSGPEPENAVSVTPTLFSVAVPVFTTAKEYVITRPTATTVLGEAVLSNEMSVAGDPVTVVDDGAELTGGPVGGVPVATAVFVTDPVSTSTWVTTYVPVQVVEAWGSSVVTGHVITGGVPVPVNAVSAAPTLVSVVLPVFTTRNEYVITRPAAVTTPGDAVFSNDRLGAVSMVTVAVDGSELTAGPVGGVPEATAVFTIEPASTSACVVTYVPVHVVDACGTNVVTGHEITGAGPEPENTVSTTPTPV
ncbi:hypothetical protein, partial [Sphaerisporangium sp. TRM90804]|uniref:hypothetical protein n=1 Tax=Sphaerisporangium sp. TRM90804 TaxID=3031113 RepID=UPI00244B9A81